MELFINSATEILPTIENQYESQEVSFNCTESFGHAFNEVEIGGATYYIDAFNGIEIQCTK